VRPAVIQPSPSEKLGDKLEPPYCLSASSWVSECVQARAIRVYPIEV
jgi:hypothetical protein